MLKTERICGALGLCRRAGKITVGSFLVLEEIKKKKAGLVLLASDSAANTEKKIVPPCERAAIPWKRLPLSKKELGKLVGKDGEAVCISVPSEFVNLVLASL